MPHWLIVASDPAQSGLTNSNTNGSLGNLNRTRSYELMRRPFTVMPNTPLQIQLSVHQFNVHQYSRRGRPSADTPYSLLYNIRAELVVNQADQRHTVVLSSHVLDTAAIRRVADTKQSNVVFVSCVTLCFFTSSATPARVGCQWRCHHLTALLAITWRVSNTIRLRQASQRANLTLGISDVSSRSPYLVSRPAAHK